MYRNGRVPRPLISDPDWDRVSASSTQPEGVNPFLAKSKPAWFPIKLPWATTSTPASKRDHDRSDSKSRGRPPPPARTLFGSFTTPKSRPSTTPTPATRGRDPLSRHKSLPISKVPYDPWHRDASPPPRRPTDSRGLDRRNTTDARLTSTPAARDRSQSRAQLDRGRSTRTVPDAGRRAADLPTPTPHLDRHRSTRTPAKVEAVPKPRTPVNATAGPSRKPKKREDTAARPTTPAARPTTPAAARPTTPATTPRRHVSTSRAHHPTTPAPAPAAERPRKESTRHKERARDGSKESGEERTRSRAGHRHADRDRDRDNEKGKGKVEDKDRHKGKEKVKEPRNDRDKPAKELTPEPSTRRATERHRSDGRKKERESSAEKRMRRENP